MGLARILSCGILLAATALLGQDLSRLPDWARAAALEARNLPIPDADALVVLNRTEMAYLGGGRVQTRKLRLVRILTSNGCEEGRYSLQGLGGRASAIKELKGWNLLPDGEIVTLPPDAVKTHGTNDWSTVSTRAVTVAELPRVRKGSWVAFESLESFSYPTGPCASAGVLEKHPIHRWELAVARKEGWFSGTRKVKVSLFPVNFESLQGRVAESSGETVVALDLPGAPEERGNASDGMDLDPWVLVRFGDPDLVDLPGQESWDQIAGWTCRTMMGKASPKAEMGIPPSDPRSTLAAVHAWMARSMAYRQVYLAPERGWVPEWVADVHRRRYGDCKDLAACLISELRHLGWKAFPVLAHRGEGRVSSAWPSFLHAFNHVMVAVQLEASLGLPGEVEAGSSRFLLWDPTDRLGAFGRLPEDHHGQEVMICTGDRGLWTQVPASAVQVPRAEIRVLGEAKAEGVVDSTLEIQEEGDALGLRSACLGGSQELKEALVARNRMGGPSDRLEVLEVADPLDTEKPFRLRVRLHQPEGMRTQGQRVQLILWGLPSPPPVLQKAGVPRRTPVRTRGLWGLDWRLDLQVPWPLVAEVPALRMDSPFRVLDWKAEDPMVGGRPHIRLSLRQQMKEAGFEAPLQEKGVVEWKKDRAAYSAFLMDAPGFRIGP